MIKEVAQHRMMASSWPVSRWRVRGEEQRSDGSCIMQPFTVSNIQQYSRLRPTAAPPMLSLESNVIISTHSLTHWLLPALLTRSFLLVCVSYFVICADRAASVSSVHTLQCNQVSAHVHILQMLSILLLRCRRLSYKWHDCMITDNTGRSRSI